MGRNSGLTAADLHPGRWWHPLPDGRIQCDLCPRDCQLHEGQRGACFVRQMVNGAMQLTTYGRSSGFCIDPIEKKPLNHFYPGSSILSFGTAGCNLACKFCQNWDISKSRDMDRLMDMASPQMIATAAKRHGADAVAYTYNDPVIFAEYAIDTALACRERGIHSVAVTSGYIHAKPRRESTDMEDLFIAHIGGMDAFAKGLEVAHALLNDSPWEAWRKERYASFDSGAGKDFEEGKLTLQDLVALAAKNGEPKQTSGKQERFENLLNQSLVRC